MIWSFVVKSRVLNLKKIKEEEKDNEFKTEDERQRWLKENKD